MKIIAIVSLLLLAPAAAVQAEDIAKPVTYGDLDLSSPQGRAALDSRLARAVNAVCGKPDLRDLPAVRSSRRCRHAAIEYARNEAELAALSYRRGDTPLASAR